MKLLELPDELLQYIVVEAYGIWKLKATAVRGITPKDRASIVKWNIEGTPPSAIELTCRKLGAFRDTAVRRSFSGTVMVVEDAPPWSGSFSIGLITGIFFQLVQARPKWSWLVDATTSLKIAGISPNRPEWRPMFNFDQLPHLRELTICRGHWQCTRFHCVFYSDGTEAGQRRVMNDFQRFLLAELDFFAICASGGRSWLLDKASERHVQVRVLKAVRYSSGPDVLYSADYGRSGKEERPFALKVRSLKIDSFVPSEESDENDIFLRDR